ncbi:MAG: L-threonylcarbamoyladenylate synthase [Oscillospiraceae bacterium]
METKVLKADEQAIKIAASLILNGEIIGMPTETVYGLAASSLDSNAVAKIFKAKGRPQDNPLISHISSMNMLNMVAQNIPDEAYMLANAFWPGPLTMVLPRSTSIADEVCAGLNTAAVRMPSHTVALALINECKVPLAAPSANISGSPSPTTAKYVYDDMNGKIPLILDGGDCEVGVESTVISLVGKPILLRPGHITKEQLEKILGKQILVSDAVLHKLAKGEATPSPGMKYKHYAPKANIILIKGSKEAYYKYISSHNEPNTYRLCFEGEQALSEIPCITYGREANATEQAQRIFKALRELDENGAEIVYARCPQESGEAMAVYNRMIRAAAFNIVEV